MVIRLRFALCILMLTSSMAYGQVDTATYGVTRFDSLNNALHVTLVPDPHKQYPNHQIGLTMRRTLIQTPGLHQIRFKVVVDPIEHLDTLFLVMIPEEKISQNSFEPEFMQSFPARQNGEYTIDFTPISWDVHIGFMAVKKGSGASSYTIQDYSIHSIQPPPQPMANYRVGGNSMQSSESRQGYRYGFNGFEKDDELKGAGNHISWGDYGYDPRLAVRWSPDKLAAKYPSQSPYSVVGNNPILHKEIDGKDYAVYVNHETKTVIVKATYYTIKSNTDDYNSAVKATQFWNEQSGKYQYQVGSGKDALYYDIQFNLNVQGVGNPTLQATIDKSNYSIDGQTKLITDGSSNSYDVLPDDHNRFKNDDPNKETNGVTRGGAAVSVKDSRKDTETGAHEVGHTLGFGHRPGVLMSEASNEGRTETVDITIIGQILKNAGMGKSNYHKSYQGSGKGNLQPSTGNTPSGFESGKVIKKKN